MNGNLESLKPILLDHFSSYLRQKKKIFAPTGTQTSHNYALKYEKTGSVLQLVCTLVELVFFFLSLNLEVF